MSDWERQIEDRVSRIPASFQRWGLADCVAWKDACSDAQKLLNKRGRTETELTAMAARLNRLAEEKK